MSTSLLYHAFGIQGYIHQRSEYVGGEVHFTVEQPPRRLRCAVCQSRRVIRRGDRKRRFRGLPIGNRAVWILLWVPRLECKACGAIRQAEVPFAPGQHRYTKRFARYVLDLDSGAVVFVGEGKGVRALDPFWKRLRRSRARIQAVALDMSQAYIRAVRDNLPDAVMVFDHFHVVKLMNDKLADLRRQLQREAEAKEKEVLKGTRWLLVKNPENLDDNRSEGDRLQQALALNAPLAAAYYLKEDLRQLWGQPNKESAALFLQGWIERARATGLRQLQQMANTLSLYRIGLLAYYDVPISTGPLEGTNNKIKTLQRQSYGFRDPEFFRLRIYALHETNLKLVG